jgi:hypothetical protein
MVQALAEEDQGREGPQQAQASPSAFSVFMQVPKSVCCFEIRFDPVVCVAFLWLWCVFRSAGVV